MPKTQAPVSTATPDNDLPMTAVKPRQKDLLMQQMQEKLAEYEEANTAASTGSPVNTANTPAEEETFRKRYSDLRRFQQQKETQLNKEVEDLKAQINQLTAAQNQPLPKTREEFEAWKNRYPDIVQFIEIIAEERASAAKSQLAEELNTVKSKLSETEKEKAYATLKVLVPDLESTVASATYKKWFANQPHFIQEILNVSDDPHQIAYYMNVFKATQAPTQPKNKTAQLDALDTSVRNTGASPSNNGGRWAFTQSQIAKMSTEEFTAKEAEIIAARNSGKILDDVSKRNTVFD